MHLDGQPPDSPIPLTPLIGRSHELHFLVQAADHGGQQRVVALFVLDDHSDQ
jgi:hypothetical protein